jgi:hypothetical protein
MTNNFLNIAKESNLYTLQNLPNEVLTDPYFIQNLEFYKERFEKIKIPETLNNIQGIEVGVFAEVRQQFKNHSEDHELYYIENYYTLIFIDENVYQLQYYKDKYSLYPIYRVVNLLSKDISNQQKYEFTRQVIEPNRIGVFTLKKLQDWAKYCKDYVQAIKDANEQVNSKSIANQKIIDDFIHELGNNCEVKKWRNTTIVETIFFQIEFELLDKGAYLSKKITYIKGIQGIIEIENKFNK